ncbi:MAG TPA: IS66 family transposase [Polyangiaceae bacterium]|nr:IS66 family transposase [Polyangiaceae bacterium]
MSESDARIQELEAKLAEFSAALGRERAERERAAHERDEYKKLYELIALELERVKRHLRAQNKSERVDAAQVQLAFAEVAKLVVPPDLAQAIADQENEQSQKPSHEPGKPRGPHGRGKIADHLPVERIELEPPESLRSCACCGKAKTKIGEETSSRLDWRPASLVHVQIARMKYAPACKCEEGGVVIASVPDAAPVDRGLAGPGLLAHVVVSKYADHLPLNRLEEGFERQGVHIARSSMCDWVEQVADLLRPITDAMATASLRAHRVHTDDTGIPILAPGSTHKGHVWVYVADDDYVVFRYTPRRKSDGPREFLRGYTGYVQADAANLYDRLFGDAEGAGENTAAKEVGCWAHARRRFFDAQLTDRDRALVGLGFIKKLYEADRVAMKLPPSRRTSERQRLCGPVLDAFKDWLDAEALVVLPKAPLADAIGYARNQWNALTRFVEDARLKLDNNIAERQLRRVAVGRKNWLFAGSENGAERGCVLYSLLATCKLHGVNPFEYLRDVIMRVDSHPARDVLELNPKAWKQKLKDLDAARSAPAPSV